MRLTLEIVGKALFSVDLSNDADALSRATMATLDHIAHRARSPLAFPLRVPTPNNRRFMAAIQTLDAAIFTLIARRRRNPDEADDLLAIVLQHKANGASQEATYAALEAVRLELACNDAEQADPSRCEALEDLMDRVWGYCPSANAIWQTSLSEVHGK